MLPLLLFVHITALVKTLSWKKFTVCRMKSKLPVTAHKAFPDQLLLPGAVIHPLLRVSCLTLQGHWAHPRAWLSALLGMSQLAPAHLSRLSSGLPSPETQSRSPPGCDRSLCPWFSWRRGPASSAVSFIQVVPVSPDFIVSVGKEWTH